jgi:glycosyltransferase involved in cell wall biosynthesis
MHPYSLIVLTYNEEVHLPRLLNSINDLEMPLFILDSGSTDATLNIAEEHGATIMINKFINHPIQWNYALENFKINTPWTIGLDADHIFTPELKTRLTGINEVDSQVMGIYFNRKNVFKGKWIRHGGYFPKYLLKMFRTGSGYSDLTEMMDHRFIVDGKTEVWKDGFIIEENLKENEIKFWINKHNRYSELVAKQEINYRLNKTKSNVDASINGNPDQKLRYYKSIWQRLPLFVRPFIYFIYRYFFKLGFLDGKEGLIFHFMQALWFRFVVDIKIYELLKKRNKKRMQHVYIRD